MPIRQVPGSDIDYFLILYDEDGRERSETDGSQLSDAIMARLKDGTNPITDVFVCSHGWQGDVPAAIDQYDRWIAAMAGCGEDLAAIQAVREGFNPMVIGLHWPSLPWGMEAVPAGTALLSVGDDAQSADIAALTAQLGDSDTTRDALSRIVGFAQTATGTTLPPSILDDYATLFDSSTLRTGSAGGRPGADQDGFDPQAIVSKIAQQEEAAASAAGAAVAVAATAAAVATGVPGTAGTAAAATTGLLGINLGSKLKDAVLAPLRQLSFWTMKDRARRFGEGGAHALLVAMEEASPRAHFHLMGHSFGCIVASGMVAGDGAAGGVALPRPVDAMLLAQGALSLWSYAGDVPFAPGKPGYFQRILAAGLVRGPIVTTRSKYDTAVGRFYPLGAAVKEQFLLGVGGFPKYGGVGAFGLQGAASAIDMTMAAATAPYDFGAARVFNLEASDVIRNGDGVAGAHGDIAHPEVAHAFWSAAIAGGAERVSSAPLDWGFTATTTSDEAPASGGSAAGNGATDTVAAVAVAVAVKRGGLLDIDVGDAPASAPEPAPMMAESPSLTRGEQPAAPTPPTASATPAPAAASTDTQPRWINATFDDLTPGDPLIKGNWYTLGFGIDVAPQAASAGASAQFAEQGLFTADTHDVALTVQLDTDDFDTSGHTAPMRVPRTGKGYTKARFDLSPRHDGPCALTATILKDGQFVQQMALTFVVGAEATGGAQPVVDTRGRAPGGIAVLQPRDLSMQIYPSGDGYDCVLCGAVATHVHLPINAGLIDAYVRSARDNLMQVVMYQDPSAGYVFQSGTDIPQSALDAALPIMAQAGALLMLTLFDGPGAGDDVRAVGEALRQLGTQPDIRLKIQIVAETLPVPWPLLYLGDASGVTPYSWDNFLGMRHVIEQIPLQNPMTVMEPQIASAPSLNVSLNLHEGIDAQMGVDVIASQRAYWKDRAGATVTERSKRADLIGALRDAQTPDQILYLFCHAVSTGLTDPGGPGGSKLELTDQLISLNDLKLGAPSSVKLAGKPLVFINACESAEMSPTFYDGFAPYFMDKGARGVIGTECKTPALFAKAWAMRFFELFLGGETLGDTVLALRREFLEQHRNPLGLLYAVHCDADTVIAPALPSVSDQKPAAAAPGAVAAGG